MRVREVRFRASSAGDKLTRAVSEGEEEIRVSEIYRWGPGEGRGLRG